MFSFAVCLIIKRALSLFIAKRQGFRYTKTLRYHSFCRTMAQPLNSGPTTASRCIGRAPSGLLEDSFSAAAQRPVYSLHRDRLAPPGGSLYRERKLLFPLQSVFSMCGALYHENRKVSSTETQKSARKIRISLWGQFMNRLYNHKNRRQGISCRLKCVFYSISMIQPSGASMRPIWMPVRVSYSF